MTKKLRNLFEYVRSIIKPVKVDELVWINGEETEEADEESTEEELPPKPMFPKGDTVVLYNPYTELYIAEEWDAIEPTRYEVEYVDYDEEDGVFRYKLARIDGEGTEEDSEDWYAEDWVRYPLAPTFYKQRQKYTIDLTDLITGGITMEVINAENAILVKAVDDDLRKREIDRFLDLLRTGNAEERKAAEKELRKLTNTKLGEE